MDSSSIWPLFLDPFAWLYVVATVFVLRLRSGLGASFLPAALGCALLLLSRLVSWLTTLYRLARHSPDAFNPLGPVDVAVLGRVLLVGAASAWLGIALVFWALLRLARLPRNAV